MIGLLFIFLVIYLGALILSIRMPVAIRFFVGGAVVAGLFFIWKAERSYHQVQIDYLQRELGPSTGLIVDPGIINVDIVQVVDFFPLPQDAKGSARKEGLFPYRHSPYCKKMFAKYHNGEVAADEKKFYCRPVRGRSRRPNRYRITGSVNHYIGLSNTIYQFPLQIHDIKIYDIDQDKIVGHYRYAEYRTCPLRHFICKSNERYFPRNLKSIYIDVFSFK